MEDLPDTQTQEEILTQFTVMPKPWGLLTSRLPDLSSFELVEEVYNVGRAPYCDICIQPSEFENWLNISKEHFSIEKGADGIVFLKDLSKNGTWVNGLKIKTQNRVILSTDDEIAFGGIKTAFTFINNGDLELNIIPRKIREKYLMSKLLGKGGCGEVWLAYKKSSGASFAIKKIVKGRTSTNLGHLNHPLKIATEIQILTTISHPFIIDMHDTIETEQEIYLVLEYMSGGVLNNRIMSPVPLPEAEVKFIFYQILTAVQYLHQNGITHRDLKAENVLLASDETYPLVKVSDFGLSKIKDDLSLMETACGSMQYVAPEILNRLSRYDRKVDVWSLGVILFLMLSKKLPFTAGDSKTLSWKILSGDIAYDRKVWAGVSYQARDLVKKMLTLNPARRISVDEMFNHPWIARDDAMRHRVELLKVQDDGEDFGFESGPLAKRARLKLDESSLDSTK